MGQICVAQTLVKSIVIELPRMMSTDESGNVYVVYKNNQLYRFTKNGDSSGFYRSISNGDIGWIDATNPLRVLLYYPSFSKVVILDKMLSPKMELDLKQLNLFNAPAVCVSGDGMLWAYDPLNAKLKKINDQLEIVVSSNDLRSETNEVPQPSSMIERDYKVYMVDSANGIYTFDRFGSYINTLPFYGINKIQVVGTQLIYRVKDSLQVYDLKANTNKAIIIPRAENLVDVRIERNRLFCLYEDRLDIFKTDD